MALAQDLLARVDQIRGIPAVLGIRPFACTIRVRTWSGGSAGAGTATDVDTVIGVAAGTQNVKCRQVSSRDIIASGGAYEEGDWRIGPFTPTYAGGGYSQAIFDPAPAAGVEVFWILTGRDMPTGGKFYKKVSTQGDRAIHYSVVIRGTAEQP